MSEGIETRADCSRCAALCCIAYPSEDMPGFAARKDAGEPCPKLDGCGACTIYDRREEEGFGGCIRYECFGAGQHVVQQLFGGRDWRDDPTLLQPMVSAFLAMRPVSDLLYLVTRAEPLAPSAEYSDRLAALRSRIEAVADSVSDLSDRSRVESLHRDLARIYASVGRASFEKS